MGTFAPSGTSVGPPLRSVYDNLAAAVRRVQFPRRSLTDRFSALTSHYGIEPCFARPGEGHDEGGVESRGRGIRLQVLTPLPRGDSLAELSERMQEAVDRLAPQQVWERFSVEGPLAASAAGGGVRGAADAAGLGQPQRAGAPGGRLVLGAGALGGAPGHGLGGRGAGDAVPGRGAGEPPPAVLRQPARELPPLPRRALPEAAGGPPGRPGAARRAGRALRAAVGAAGGRARRP